MKIEKWWGFPAFWSVSYYLPASIGPRGHSLRSAKCTRLLFGRHLLRSFNGPEPGGPESTEKKVKVRERGWYSLAYMPKANKVPGTELALFTEAAGALSMGWRRRAPSRERVLEALAGKWTQRASVLQGISLKKKERWGGRERERERKTRGPKLWWSKGVL